MTRRVFFSFHYQRDIRRVMQVRNHYITKENYTEAGYFDGSLEEKSKKEGDQSVKRLIDNGLIGSSVLCVLIGAETYQRRWVHYEIFKSIELGMGIFGVRIHGLRDPNFGVDNPGISPFDILGYELGAAGERKPAISFTYGWKTAPNVSPLYQPSAPYLKNIGSTSLTNLFPVYDWLQNDGYSHFGIWIEAAARQAGRR